MEKRLGIAIIIIIFALGAGAIYLIPQLSINFDFERFFPQDDEQYAFYDEYRSHFGTDNDFILLGIAQDEGVYKADFIQSLFQLTDSLNALYGVTHVISPTNLELPLITQGGLFRVPFISPEPKTDYSKDSVRISRSPEITGNFVSKDAKSVTLYIKTVDLLSKQGSDSLSHQLHSLMDKQPFEEYHIAGKAVTQTVYIETMGFELLLFISCSLFVVITFLFISFRSLWGVIIPFLVVTFTVIFVLALIKLLGRELDIMTTLLPTILFVVGTSDVVHLVSKYIDELRKGNDKLQAIKLTIKEIGFATFLTSLTTSVGFATLLVAIIAPVQEFGIFTAAGVIIAFLVSITLLPAILINVRKPKLAERKKGSNWEGFLSRMFVLVAKNPGRIIISYVFLLGLCFWGIYLAKVNIYLLEDLKPSSTLKKDLAWFEEKFEGGRAFEMAIELKDSNISFLDYEVISELSSLEAFMKDNYGMENTLSPISLIKSFNKAIHEGDPAYYAIPPKEEYQSLKRKLKPLLQRKESRVVISKDQRWARINGFMGDIGSYKMKPLNDKLDNWIAQNTDPSRIKYTRTGTAHLLESVNETLSANLLKGLSIAFAIIALIVGIMFETIRMVLISFVPNIVPLLILGAVIGFFELDLKISTSIIFTIAFGIAVDDTIHMLSKYRIELGKGHSPILALRRTFISTGKAIIVTSFVLCGGFISLTFSEFTSTAYLGMLTTLTLFLALVADLTIFPALILLTYGGRRKKDL